MNLMDPKDLKVKIILFIPAFICLLVFAMIKKTDGNIIAGFNTLSEDEKNRLRKLGFVSKTLKLVFLMTAIFTLVFLSSFFITDINIFDKIVFYSYLIFAVVTVSGIIFINISSKK